tara:strand:- start:5251 stop:5550 length:300 start_codon:yes stop_codon:yes gene_type:complete
MGSKYYKGEWVVSYLNVTEIKGDFDEFSLQNLIRQDRGYDWARLLCDIDQEGLKELIEVEKRGVDYRVIQGNHRLKVLQYLYPSNNILRFKLKRYETNK